MNRLSKKLITPVITPGCVIATLVTFLFISACSTLTTDIEVEVHTYPDVNYNAYKTYAWAGSTQIVYDPIGQWKQPTLDTEEEGKFIIKRELRALGLNLVEHNSDLLVAFAAGIDTKVLGLKENPKRNKKLLTNIPKAALVIVLIDANTGYPVWSGYATGDIQQQQTIDDIRTRIHYAVSEIFKPYNK